MTARIKLRRDTAANWTNNNPILALGEPGFETDTNKLKVGDGVSAWSDLVYTSGGAGGAMSVDMQPDYIYDTLQSGAPNWLIGNGNGVFVENTNWGWDQGGLWFQGDLSDNNGNQGPNPQPGFVVTSNFVINSSIDTTISYDFVATRDAQSNNWGDQGICVFLDGTTPLWVWEGWANDTIVAKFNGDQLNLDGIPENGTTYPVSSNLINGTEYHVEFEYAPNNNTTTVSVYLASDWYAAPYNANPITVGVVNGTVDGNYRVGFGADPDTPDFKAYIKNVKISFNNGDPALFPTITQEVSVTTDGQIKLPGDMIIGSVRDDDYIMWAPKNAEYAGIWWGGDRHDNNNNNNGYGPDASITVGIDSNDDTNASSYQVGVNVALQAKDKSWTFDEQGELTGPDRKLSVKGDIEVSGDLVGWISTLGPVSNNDWDIWFDHVVNDPSGNVYAIGGNWGNAKVIQVAKYNSSGALQWQRRSQIVSGSNTEVTSAEWNANNGCVTAVIRYYANGVWLGGIIDIDASNGSLITPITTLTDPQGNNFELFDLDFMSSGDLVYVGQAAPSPNVFTVTTNDIIDQNMGQGKFRILRSIFNNEKVQTYGWRISGGTINGSVYITDAADTYNNVDWTTDGVMSGAAFNISYNQWQLNYNININSWAYGTTPNNGEVVTIKGSNLGGIDGGRINVGATYTTSAAIDGTGPYAVYFDSASYPTFDQDIINGNFIYFTNGSAGVITNIYNDAGQGRWVVSVDNLFGTFPTGSGVTAQFYAGNDLTFRVQSYGWNPQIFYTYDQDGLQQLNTAVLQSADWVDFSIPDQTYQLTDFSNTNALLKTPNWEKTYGTPDNNESWTHTAVDSLNNVYAAGWSEQDSQTVITKFDFMGNVQWSKAYKRTGTTLNFGSITVDNNNNLILTGRDNDWYTPVVYKIDPDGNIVWVSHLQLDGVVNSWDWNYNTTAVVDKDNNILVSDTFSVWNSNQYNTQGWDLFVARINGDDGTSMWTRYLGTAGDDWNGYDYQGYHISTTGSNYNIVGYYSANQDDAYVAQLPIDGSGYGNSGTVTYRDAQLAFSVDNSGDYTITDSAIVITDCDVVVSDTRNPDLDDATTIATQFQLIDTATGGNVTVKVLTFGDGTTQTSAAKSADSSWVNGNGNTWRIETYNGGFNGYYDGGDLVWFDPANSPSGNGNFRGAIVEYHAYVNWGTIVGTIWIANDYRADGEYTHTEFMSGGSNINGSVLWQGNNSWGGQLIYKHVQGYSHDVMIQWTARMFYGNEANC